MSGDAQSGGGMIQQIGWMGDEVDAATPVATDGGERTDAR